MEKYICKNHFSDEKILDFIEENSVEGICSYCKLRYQDGQAVDLSELSEFIEDGLEYFYGNPDNEGVSYDSSEGGYLFTTIYSSLELIQNEIDIDSFQLEQDIAYTFSNQVWCRLDPYVLPEHQELAYDWKRFCDIVKHKIRYSFFATKEFDFTEKQFSQILHDVAHGIDSLDLIKEVNVGTQFYRCRQHTVKEKPSSIVELSSPPEKYATFANRMSPAGISMFYGAYDTNTTIKEVLDDDQATAKPNITIGTFIVKKKLFLIDFTELPELPSIFDEKKRVHYYKILFFHSFVHDLSKDIKRDDRIHTEYVPTQILTEYFRYVFPELTKIEVDGIKYQSSKNENGKCLVLFFDNKESQEYLELENFETKSISSLI